MKQAAGPLISANIEVDNQGILELYKSYNLERLQPRFMEYSPEYKKVKTNATLPEVKDVSPTLPEVMSYNFVIPGVEPTLAFEDFIRGVACTAYICPEEYQPAIQSALTSVAERTLNTGTLPHLDSAFENYVDDGIRTIFGNGEPTNWRGLLAFQQGSYWLLGFIENPLLERGKKGNSPLGYVHSLVEYFAQLGYVPR